MQKERLVLIVAILASFVGGLDGFIVNVALPAISRDLGGGLAVQQWTVDAYLITLGAFILIAGSLSDLLGRKRIMNLGLWWFGITSLLCAIAPNGTYLIIARALQGIAGALLVPSSLALIMSTFKGAAQSKAIGTWTGWTVISSLAGPLLGGLIVAVTSWRWIFAINVIPIAVTLYMLNKIDMPNSSGKRSDIDVLGAALCVIGLGGSVYALIEQQKYGWDNPLIWLPLMFGILSLIAFVAHERQSQNPMLPLSLFRSRNVVFGNLATLAIYAGLSLVSFVMVITLQQVAHYSAFQAGMASLPVTAIMFVMSGRFGALAGKFGPRLFMTLGPLVAATGFLLMLRTHANVNYLTELLPALLCFGLGLSITVAPLTSAILGAVPTERSGVASAVNNAIARIAGLGSIAVVGVITGPNLTIDGFHRAVAVVAGLMLVGSLVSFIGIRNSTKQAKDKSQPIAV